MPISSAARMIRVPLSTETSTSSIVTVIKFMVRVRPCGAMVNAVSSFERRRLRGGCRRPEHGSGLDGRIEVEWHIEVLGSEQWCGRAARRPELEWLAAAHPTGHVDQLAEGSSHRGLVLTRPNDASGQRVDARAG